MTHVELHHGAASDVGLVPEINEDAFLVADRPDDSDAQRMSLEQKGGALS